MKQWMKAENGHGRGSSFLFRLPGYGFVRKPPFRVRLLHVGRLLLPPWVRTQEGRRGGGRLLAEPATNQRMPLGTLGGERLTSTSCSCEGAGAAAP